VLWLPAISTSGAIIGIILVYLAWRGRRIDDHPLCRKCGFDLTGRSPQAERCSECGALLSRRRAIRIGHRRKHRLGLVSGFILFLIATVWLTVGRKFDPTVFKPVSWLLRDAASANPPRRDPATARLLTLLNQGALDQHQTQALVRLILAAQVDPNRPWVPAFGKVVEDLHERKQLSDDLWQTYWRQAWNVQFLVRPKVRTGDPLPMAILVNKLPLVSTLNGDATFQVVELRIDGQAWYPPRHPLEEVAPATSPSTPRRQINLLFPPMVTQHIPDGRHTVNCIVEFDIQRPTWRWAMFSPKTQPRLPTPIRQSFSTSFELLPGYTPAASVVPHDIGEFSKSLSAKFFEIRAPAGSASRASVIQVQVNSAPVDFCFDVFLRTDEGETSLGTLTCHPRQSTKRNYVANFEGARQKKFDLILRPNSQLAATLVSMDPICGQELVISNISMVNPHVVDLSEVSDWSAR